MAAIGMSRRAKKMCSIRGENRARLIVTVPMAASTPMPTYRNMIAARAMPASRAEVGGGLTPGSSARPIRPGHRSPVVVPGRMEHVEDGAGRQGARGVALVRRDVEDLARSEHV